MYENDINTITSRRHDRYSFLQSQDRGARDSGAPGQESCAFHSVESRISRRALQHDTRLRATLQLSRPRLNKIGGDAAAYFKLVLVLVLVLVLRLTLVDTLFECFWCRRSA
jgi:hypothetical protein